MTDLLERGLGGSSIGYRLRGGQVITHDNKDGVGWLETCYYPMDVDYGDIS